MRKGRGSTQAASKGEPPMHGGKDGAAGDAREGEE